MRQLQDMRASTASVLLVNAGALGLAFGVGSALAGAFDRPWAWASATVGMLMLAAGAMLRAPSQARAYAHYLQGQDLSDLSEALRAGWAEGKSREAIEDEVARRAGK